MVAQHLKIYAELPYNTRLVLVPDKQKYVSIYGNCVDNNLDSIMVLSVYNTEAGILRISDVIELPFKSF